MFHGKHFTISFHAAIRPSSLLDLPKAWHLMVIIVIIKLLTKIISILDNILSTYGTWAHSLMICSTELKASRTLGL